jgi:signal transduction histidine kinase/CheY-like chemotaxis protein
MNELKTLLGLIAQMTGSYGGISFGIVHFVFAALFFGFLFVFARAKHRETRSPRELLLMWGFGLGFSREMFMLLLAVVQALKWVDPVSLHVVFPPLEHAIRTASLIIVAAAYLRYLLDDEKITRRYLQAALGSTALCYLVTFWWWSQFIQANPASKFGQTWCDWVFHINSSSWFLLAAVILAVKVKGWQRNTVVTAFSFFFIADFLKLPDMALGEAYENIFNPFGRLFYLSAIPMLGYIYVRETLQDLKHYTRSLETQVKARAIAEQMAQAKSSFLTTMSHEIRTPMNGVIGMTQLLANTPLNKEQEGFVSTIHKSGETVLLVLNNILDYSKIQADGIKLEHIVFNLSNLLYECRTIFSYQALQSGIQLDIQLAENLPKLVGDPLRIRQVLINLIGNAYKFTKLGQITVRVNLSLDSDTTACVRFEIQDTGIGIAQAQQAHLFEAYSQADPTIYRRFGGSGLGLSISQQLINLMQGEIGVRSELGKGALFWFSIPMEIAHTQVPLKAIPNDITAGEFSHLKILVVDDYPINLQVMTAQLQRLGVQAHTAVDGAQALQILMTKDSVFDLVFMDCEMPIIDGYVATQNLREWERQDKRKPIYVCGASAHALPEYRERAMASGMDEFITKPLRTEDLQKVLILATGGKPIH